LLCLFQYVSLTSTQLIFARSGHALEWQLLLHKSPDKIRTLAQEEMSSCLDLVDESPEILGNALVPKMECADNYGGRIRALPGLCTWGYRARTRAARSFEQPPCWLDEKSNGRTTPQYECICDGRADIRHMRRRDEVLGRPLWGKRTKSRT
jgi:hypothetical protein